MTLPSLFIPHGAGPCFFMQWSYGPADMWASMSDWLQGLASSLEARPRAILVISAHWEAEVFSVTSALHPSLIYDYTGFPPHTYQLRYPVMGAPQLAQEIRQRLATAGLPAVLDGKRGLDHGAFIPFKLIYPLADIPMLQLSLRSDLDAEAHFAAGEALSALKAEGVLIVGSGMSFHNLQPSGRAVEARAAEFDDWLARAAAMEPGARREQLIGWPDAPHARFAHPREEHLLPLLVACGASASQPARRIYAERLGGVVDISAFRFG
ncbi:DODA-type extradiol aromatic ring-opening family dioxygenase [Pseudomonas nicosulfuronedens]